MDEVEAAKTLCAQERFIFCYRYLTELFHYLRQRAREEATLHGIREDCYGAIDQKNANIVLEPKSIKRYYNDWFKQGYILSKLFQEKLAEVKKVCLAMHDVCGLRINNRDENTVHFIQAVLKADDLLEIAFWKRKFIEQGVSTIFKHNGEKTLPTIVVCVQQSDAMRSLLNMHIGLICAILVISENERRDFVCIPYAEQVAKESFSEKGQFTIAQYMEIVQQFLGGDGAPNYRQLLNTAFTMLKLSATSSSGEIVLICDDQIGAHVPQDEAWQKAVQKYKKDMNIRVIVLYSGNFNPEMSIWFADRVMFIEDFQSKIEVM